jgi:hypothetical protein
MTSAHPAEELAAIIEETCEPWAMAADQPYEVLLYDCEFDLSARIVKKFGKGIVDEPFGVFGRIAVRAYLFASVALKRARKAAGSATAMFAARLALGASKDLAEASGMTNDHLKLRARFPFGAVVVACESTDEASYASTAVEEWLAASELKPSERTAAIVHLQDIITSISPTTGLFTRARLSDFSEAAAAVVSAELERRDAGKKAYDQAVHDAMATITDEKEIYGAKDVLGQFVQNVKDVLYESSELEPAFQGIRKAIKRSRPADESVWSWLRRTKDTEPELNRFYRIARDYDPDDVRSPARPRRDTPSPPIMMKAIVSDNPVVTPSPKKLRFA